MLDPSVIDALDPLERYASAFAEISREPNAHFCRPQLRPMLRREKTARRVGQPTIGVERDEAA